MTLRWRNKEARVCMEDISAIGMGVFAGTEVGRLIHIQPGLGVRLEFDLAETPFENLEGRLCTASGWGSTSTSWGCAFSPMETAALLGCTFITQRRREILDEIGEIYLRYAIARHREPVFLNRPLIPIIYWPPAG